MVRTAGADLLSITGRRRVGKTYLVKETLREAGIDFKVSGLQNGNLSDQMLAFEFALCEQTGEEPTGGG